MNTDEYIMKMLSGKLDVYKQIEMHGITYMFQNKETYKKFFETKAYRWADMFPECLIQKFIDEDFKIYCVSETIVNGESSFADGTFICSLDSEGRKANSLIIEVDDNPGVFFHEFAHFIDAKAGDKTCAFSNTSELKSIVIKEGTNFGSCYVINYESYGILRDTVKKRHDLGYAQAVYYLQLHEYFAEAFSIYLMDPKLLRRLCPETYNYIDKIYCSFF